MGPKKGDKSGEEKKTKVKKDQKGKEKVQEKKNPPKSKSEPKKVQTKAERKGQPPKTLVHVAEVHAEPTSPSIASNVDSPGSPASVASDATTSARRGRGRGKTAAKQKGQQRSTSRDSDGKPAAKSSKSSKGKKRSSGSSFSESPTHPSAPKSQKSPLEMYHATYGDDSPVERESEDDSDPNNSRDVNSDNMEVEQSGDGGEGPGPDMPTITAPKNKRRRKPVEECVTLEQKFEDLAVDFIEAHPCIWYPSDKNYKNKQSKQTAWATIAEKCGLTTEKMQKWWESQRDRYVREKRERDERPSGSGNQPYTPSAKSLWLAQRLAFYGKVCKHQRKSLKSIRAAQAKRDGTEMDPEELAHNTAEDVDSGAVDQSQSTRGRAKNKSVAAADILGEISRHLQSVARAREDISKPKTIQQAYAELVATWINNVGPDQFEQVQDDLNVYMKNSNQRFAKPKPRAASQIGPQVVVLDDNSSTGSGYVSRNPTTPSANVSSTNYYSDISPGGSTSEPTSQGEWQMPPEQWDNRPFNPNFPLFKTQTRDFMNKYTARMRAQANLRDPNVLYSESSLHTPSSTYSYSQVASQPTETGYGEEMPTFVHPRNNMPYTLNTNYGNVQAVQAQPTMMPPPSNERYTLTELQQQQQQGDIAGIRKAPRRPPQATPTKQILPQSLPSSAPPNLSRVPDTATITNLASTGAQIASSMQSVNEPESIPETQSSNASNDDNASIHVNTASEDGEGEGDGDGAE